MNEISMVVVFFAILLGAVITLILISAYKNSRYSNNERMPDRSNTVRSARVQQTKKSTAQSPAPAPKSSKKTASQKTSYLPYRKTYLLTKREYNFYKELKPIADKYDLQILAKIRLADLVSVDDDVSPKYYDAYFNKIKSKHIDFAIADNMRIIALLELDDSTHSRADRIERDEFVDSVVKKCGYDIIHTYGELKSTEKAMIKYRKSTVRAIS
ncbi:MAG: DUF2726 domain-containing protein [Ruminococcus flavefaciens]|nr:DUF2726 domain-containing protein [Ruminococcus flavefaciens]